MKPMSYVIGVDAGGSKTHAVVYDSDNRMVHECYMGMGNMNVDREQAIKNCQYAIDDCLEHINEKAFICVGAAGITAKGNKEALRQALQDRYSDHHTHITSDAYLALYAKLEGKDGVLLISGTGSVVFGKANGVINRVGGWGHILGDEGSGYAIALGALKKMFNDYDAGKPCSKLSQRLLERIGAKTVYEVIELVYQHPKGDVAALFKDIANMAQQGDADAIALLHKGADDLAAMIKMLVIKMDFGQIVHIAFSGSVVVHVDILRKRLLKRLSTIEPTFHLCENQNIAPLGAVYIYEEIQRH